MICTSNYKQQFNDNYRAVSISGDRGKEAKYSGECYPELAPKMSFWRIWKDNIGIVPPKENNLFYITEYYKQVLSKLDSQEVYDELDGSILLCYEKPENFCHRQIVAAWFELLLDIEVPDVKVSNDRLEFIDKKYEVKQILEQVMKENQDMKGFTSLRALYLNKKSKEATLKYIREKDEEKKKELGEKALELKIQAMYAERFEKQNGECNRKKRVQRLQRRHD